MRVKSPFTLLAAVAAILLATGVSSASGAASKPSSKSKSSTSRAVVRISTRVVPGLGRILVDSKGRTLYMFVPDKRKRVTCVSTCAKIWPPLKVAKNVKFVAKGGVKARLLSSDPDPAGGRVATYHGWPLYLYLGDRKPGDVAGQALNLNGGLWYVLAPSGAVIKKKLHSATSGTGSGTTTTTKSGTTTTTRSGTTTTTKGGGGALCSDADGDGDEDAGGPDDGDGCL